MITSRRCTVSAARSQRGTRSTGRRPNAIRTIATSGPESRAAATFAANAIAPNIIAEANMNRRARCVAFFGNVNCREDYQMDISDRAAISDRVAISYRDAVRGDAPAIIEFQRAMARETEDLELDAATVARGV